VKQGYPLALRGMRIGLLGGSFDPPHAGHVHISHRAMRRFGLQQVWWLVSPGNPLKPEPPARIARRLAACQALVRHPRIIVTDVERKMGTRFTADTITGLKAQYHGVNFVWLMGADNLAGFHRWEHWQDIMREVAVGVMSRPGDQLSAGLSPAARVFVRARLPAIASRQLATTPAPAWVLMSGPMVDASSTDLRQSGVWSR